MQSSTVHVLGNELKDRSAASFETALLNSLKSHDLDIKTVLSLGSDGANVFVGRHNGVAVRLEEKRNRSTSTASTIRRHSLLAKQ